MRLADIFLLPKELFRRLSDKRTTLYLGMALVGLIDLLLLIGGSPIKGYFVQKQGNALASNIALSIAFIIVFGIMDVLFFSFPLYDFMRFLGKRAGFEGNGSVIRIAKVYTLANLIVMPINVVLLLTVGYFDMRGLNMPVILGDIWGFFYFITPLWFCAVIWRGLNVLYKPDTRYKLLLFALILLWNLLLGEALGYAGGIFIKNLFM